MAKISSPAPSKTSAALSPELSVFSVTFVSNTDTSFEHFLFSDASVIIANAISELSVFVVAPDATAAEPPGVAAFAAEPSEHTYEHFVCPDEVMEAVSESPVIPVLVVEANHEFSALPVTVAKTASEFTALSR